MGDVAQYMFKHKEVVEALIKAQGLHEGLWQLSLTFGFGAMNAGPNENDLNPRAVIPVTAIGLQQAAIAAHSNIVVDAAVVNPKP